MEIIAIIPFKDYFLTENEITSNQKCFIVDERGGLKLERPSFFLERKTLVQVGRLICNLILMLI